MSIGAIAEGGCPQCDNRLESCNDHGTCPDGHGCWSMSGGDIKFHIHVNWPPAKPQMGT